MNRGCALLLALLAPIFAGACVGAGRVSEVIVVPLRLENDRPYVDVFVNGEGPFNFLIDTGASGDGRIDTAPVARLGVPLVGTVENSDGVNSRDERIASLERISVGGFSRSDLRVMTRDYNPPSRDPSLARLDGILGIEFFAGSVATIDSPGRRLVIERGALNPNSEHVVPFEEPNRVPLQIGGAMHTCGIDSGSVVTAHLPLSMADSLVVGELADAGAGRRANTTFTFRRGRIGADLTLAGNRIGGLDALFSDRALDINVGSGLLSRYVVSIDATNRCFRIAPDAPGPGVIVQEVGER